ncbi:MAG: amidohydrolase [Candidatus Dormibacteraeota bacterium]|nr:amidohydrolase [Candidatus Dormibacteraeota bacterium]
MKRLTNGPGAAFDVHQHLWTANLVAALRARRRPPCLEAWRLHLEGEPPFEVDPAAHDPSARAELARQDGAAVVVLGPSSPLGIEWLAPDEAAPLLDAYHDGALALGEPFAVWATAGLREIDANGLRRRLQQGCVGLQLPADAVADEAGYERCSPLLRVLEEFGRPLFVHAGQAGAASRSEPGWWPALVPYVEQMHRAWFAHRAWGRVRHPGLRVCFAMLAGLAPLHAERLEARGGGRLVFDPCTFLETSSYGPRAIDATVRVVGIDPLVHGSDRPYASPCHPDLGPSAVRAMISSNPARLLGLPTGG